MRLLISALLLLCACVGSVVTPSSSSPSTPGVPTPPTDQPVPVEQLTCDPATRGLGEDAMRRLSKPELISVWRDVFGAPLLAKPDVVSAFELLRNENPKDPGREFNPGGVDLDALFTAASRLVDGALADSALKQQLLGQCTDALCLDGLTGAFATKAFRRPLTDAEKTRIRSYATQVGGADGLRFGMLRVLLAPEATHHLELDGTVDGARVKVSPTEIASRLAFGLTGGPPDALLLTAAAEGRLATLDAVKTEGRRLLQTTAAREHVTQLVRFWLGLDKLSDPPAEVGKGLQLSVTGFGNEARDELLRFAQYELFEKNATFTQLATDKTVFATTDRLAAVFGVPKSDAPQTLSDARGGLFFRPANAVSVTSHSNPILRGVAIRTRLLCDSIPAPPVDEVSARLGTLQATPLTHSTRDIQTEATSPASCQACHARINGLGFPFEQVGPMGEMRSEELVWDADGKVVARHAIVTAVDDVKLQPGRVDAVQGPAEMLQLIASEKKVKQCFVSHLVMDTRLRPTRAADGCTINEAAQQLTDGATVLDAVLHAVANDDIFWRAAPN